MNLKAILLAACCSAATQAIAAPAYTITRSIPLGGPDKWDYVSYDAATKRVMVAHFDHTDIIDEASGKVVGKLAGLHGAHGQAVAADGTIYADSGKTKDITAFDPKSFKPGKTLPAALDADGVIYEPKNNFVVVLNGDAEMATLIDATKQKVKANVKLGGAPEFAAADDKGVIYVNLASNNQIARLDAETAMVTAHFSVAGCQSPHGLAMDPATRRLFTTCENLKMMVVDADSGKIIQTLPIGQGTDAAAFDPVRKLVYSSNGDGTLSVFHEAADGTLTALGDVKTVPGARTLAVNPENGRVFLVAADVDTKKPATQNSYGAKYALKPGSVHLLYLDPPAK
jgi:DNA-binding beta-propeller fold protein YncE